MATQVTSTGEDMVDQSTAAEQGQHAAVATLAAESLSHSTARTGYDRGHSLNSINSQAATQETNVISYENHSCLTNTEPEISALSTNITGSCSDKQPIFPDGVYSAGGHCSESVSQEIREFTNTPAFVFNEHNSITIMDIERDIDQRARLDRLQMAQQGLHQETEGKLHQEAEQGLHQEVGHILHQEAEQILHLHDTVASSGISELNKPAFDCSAFIRPVIPSGLQQLSHSVCEDVSAAYGDSVEVIMEDDQDLHSLHVSSVDDSRYNLTYDSVPRLAASTSCEFQQAEENFLRGCKWSPDGSCVLTNSNDNCLRVFNPCSDAIRLTENTPLTASVRMKECSLVYDFAWHPQMNLSQSDYCRVACTCSGIPIHLWNTTTGQIVANYRAYDQFDEITAAYSVSFSLDGQKIYAGYNKAIRIFDTDYPVRSCKTVKTYNSQRKDGLTGIISSFAFSPDGNGLYVAGSYSRHVGLYDSACDKLVCLMQGQHGGVTHLVFSPDATKLYSGGRKDAEILCWDVRRMDKLLFSALRDVKTNQRMYFDLSQSGRYLVSGNNDGTVAFWDTLSPIEEINGGPFVKPCSQFQAHGDCVNGVSFNHHTHILATASGQRHFQNFDYDSSDSAEEENKQPAGSLDFSLRLWQIPVLSQ